MRITDAVKHMCEKSGQGVVGVSQALGKSRMYLSALISRGSYPRTDTLVQIAQACGYGTEAALRIAFRKRFGQSMRAWRANSSR